MAHIRDVERASDSKFHHKHKHREDPLFLVIEAIQEYSETTNRGDNVRNEEGSSHACRVFEVTAKSLSYKLAHA